MHGKHRTSPPGAELRFGSGECVAPPQPNARYELPSPPWAELRRTYSAFAVEYLTGRAETKSIWLRLYSPRNGYDNIIWLTDPLLSDPWDKLGMLNQ